MTDVPKSASPTTTAETFAPVVALRHGGVVAYRASVDGRAEALDAPALTRAAERFSAAQLSGKLLVNIDPKLARRSRPGRERVDQLLRTAGLLPNQVIIEVTRPRGVLEALALYRSLREVRTLGFDVAVDDLRQGDVNLSGWSNVQPDLLRVGREALASLHLDATRFQFVRLIHQLAQNLGSQVLASEVANEEELRVLRDLGIELAEGPVIGANSDIASARISPELIASMGWSERRALATVQPPRTRRLSLGDVARPIAAAQAQTELGVLERRFASQAGLDTIAVVHDGAVLGCVRRASLAARRDRRDWDRWSERRVDECMDPVPLMLDGQLSLQDACVLLAQSDATQFAGPVVVTERGRYLGLANAQQLMQELTHFEANRNINPLTGIPGDFPIHEAIQSLLDQRAPFVACSADIAHLKPYNQVFGYSRGDNLIKYTAVLLQAYCDERLDFFGQHSGGEFMMLLRRPDWQERLDAVVTQFASGRHAFLEREDLERGGYLCHDRRGNAVFNPLPELAIGVVNIIPGFFTSFHQVIEALHQATAEAKKSKGSSVFVERRRSVQHAPA